MKIHGLATLAAVILCAGLWAGCATASRHSTVPLDRADEDTSYGIRDMQEGFEIELYYARYQFFPESDAVATACKSHLTSLAWKHADERKREIEPLNEQRIRISMGRNGVTGITSCRANVTARWRKPLPAPQP